MSIRKNPMQVMMERRRAGEKIGIPSYCTANELVIEEILLRAKETNIPTLIEATANQVNQFGGYTGMKPADYCRFVLDLAKKTGCPEELIILAGDHLGPLTWQHLPEAEAMANAEELVYQYTRAGFTKIHLDTSMKVADDPDGLLSTETIAGRGVRLYQVCMRAYEDLLKEKPDAVRPVFIIGSEVPIPGGAQEAEEGLTVTSPKAFEDTVNTYKRMFREAGAEDGWNDVIAVVVQPGVEFGDDQVFLYDSGAAQALTAKLKEYPEVVFEGHSTDYQSAESLRDMVLDGICILKVGPSLTYAMREAVFALSMMEKELVPAEEQAYVIETLEHVMTDEPANWQKHYHGSLKELALARKYSFSDRARYYMGEEKVTAAIGKLFGNLRKYTIPVNMLHQYMPLQFDKVRTGTLQMDPKGLVLDAVLQFLYDYEYAAGIPVEAELGKVGGKEDGLVVTGDSPYTDPGEAGVFVERTGVDALAVGIGTAHGFYKGKPHVDLERLSEIRAAVDIPLVLHGTSGVPDETVAEAVKRGICKVNYATELRAAFSEGVKEVMKADPAVYDPKKYNKAGREKVKQLVMKRIDNLRSAGRA